MYLLYILFLRGTYDKQCAVLNDSILYTQSGVTEAGEETYLKTLDLDICPINPQNSLLSPSASSNDITETNVKMIDLSSHVASSKTNSIQRTDALNSVASGSKHPNDRLSQNAYGPKYDKRSEQPNGTGSLGVDTTEGVVTENCSDELVNRHHTSAKSLRVPTNECTNLSQYDSEQESITKTLDVDSTDLKQTQDTTSSGAVKTSGGGTNPKAGKQTSRQNKKSDKSKLKEGEQEEQLKLARSLISNLERKVVELENSNRILRQDLIAPSSSSNNQNNVNTHTPPSNIAMSKDSDVKVQVPPRTLENDIRNMKEHLNCLELEQMKARILNIENHIQTQTRLNAMQTPGHMGLPYTNPYVVGGNGQWQGGPVILGQNSHIPFPYPFHGPYQHFISECSFLNPERSAFIEKLLENPALQHIPSSQFQNPELVTQLTLDASVVLDKEKVDKDSWGLLELQTREFIHKIHHKRLSELKRLAVF